MGLGFGRRLKTNIKAAIRHLVGHLGIALLLLDVRIVVDKVVPAGIFQLGGHEVQSGCLLRPAVTGIATSIDHQTLVAGNGEIGSNRATSGTRADDDEVVVINCGVIGAPDERVMVSLVSRRPGNSTVMRESIHILVGLSPGPANVLFTKLAPNRLVAE